MPDTINSEFESVIDVDTQRVAKLYAEALYGAAEKRDQAREVLDELHSLVSDVFKANPQIENFLTSVIIGRDRKTDLIKDGFANRASETLVNFLFVLNNHERLDLIRPILAAYQELYDQKAGRIHVQVRTAQALPDDQRDSLHRELKQAFQKEPILETKVEPDLLGGLVVQVGDWLYDASVRSSLENLRNQIIERSSHEIQSGRDRFSARNGN
ncbi:MAG: ATP synthase F1 subunit delta [Gemmataceae bacterium]